MPTTPPPDPIDLDEDEPGPEEPSRPRRPLWQRLLPLLVLAAGLATAFALDLHHYLSWDTLRENRHALLAAVSEAPVRTALIYVAVYTAAAAFSIPGAVFLSIGAGYLFGLFPGTPLAMTGATLGATCVFLAARTAVGDFLERKLGRSFRRLEHGFQKNAFSYMLFLRFMPLFPFWFVNLAAGLLKVRPRDFVLGTIVGIIPGSLVYVSVGNGLGAVLDAGGTPDLGVIFRPAILLPILGMSLLSLVPILYRRSKARRNRAHST